MRPKNPILTLNDCIKHAEALGGKCLSDEYVSIITKMRWSCHKGHVWEVAFNGIKNMDNWCPTCGLKISKPQINIHNELDSYFTNLHIILNDTKIISPMDLDIFIPSLSIGIEYDGEYWHHSAWAIEHGSIEKMAIKDAKCKLLGIKLIRVREKDYKQNKNLAMKRLYDFIEANNKENLI
jgi:hypothetical protein